ncbi:hypothetical protein ACVR0S_09585 [Streptococcus dentapri]|uniref:Uncharacterized protein n=1 Tax=Streptococcus dentapri TaxID=573564 RepID=A0ABV8D292_9STRE
MSLKYKKYNYCSIEENVEKNRYIIFWTRGKEHYSYPITAELAEKLANSSKDELEVMFYAEKGRWPKVGELDHYNETKVITHKGNGFLVYEEDGHYEMRWQTGSHDSREAAYPITKELMDKAFQSDQDAYDVKTYLTTGLWPSHDQDAIDCSFIRQYPEVLLRNPEASRSLFSEDEFERLLKKAHEASDTEN